MPYHNRGLSLQHLRGDPGFFGSIGRAIGGVAKKAGGAAIGAAARFAPGPVGIAARFAQGRLTAPRGRAQQRRAGRAMARVSIPFGGPGGFRFQDRDGRVGGGRGIPFRDVDPFEAPKRRRMNPLNPKALSRSTRRLAAFTRRVRSVEKQLRKIAPRSRSRPRADLGPGHRHIK